MKEVFEAAETKMNKTVNALINEYAAIRAGRANPAILDKIAVDYYGVPTPVNQMAAVSVPDARTILIAPWDKSTLKAIEKAIQTSDIGLNPQNDGSSLRLNFPPLTEERRKELVKQIKAETETARVSLRGIRRDLVDAFKKAQKDGMPEDAAKDGEESAQKLTDKYAKKVDDLFSAKEKEIMTV